MFGISKLFQSKEPLVIKKGDIFIAETTEKSACFPFDNLKEVTTREVIILDNMRNNFGSTILALSITKTSKRIMKNDIGDLIRIRISDLKEKIGEISEQSLENIEKSLKINMKSGNFESIPIEY